MGSYFVKPCIERLAFPGCAPRYNKEHPNLMFVENRIACMRYHTKSPFIILYSHGNACDIGRVHEYLSILSELTGLNIISYDYPGFGLSNGTTSEKSCKEAITSVYNFLRQNGFENHQIILYGTSIGTGPSVELASRIKNLKGVLLQSPYTSAVGVYSPTLEYTSQFVSPVFGTANIFRTSELIGFVQAPSKITSHLAINKPKSNPSHRK